MDRVCTLDDINSSSDEENDIIIPKIKQLQGDLFLTLIDSQVTFIKKNIDEKHVLKLKNGIERTKQVYNSFEIGTCLANEKDYLVNGHHRVAALKMIKPNILKKIMIICNYRIFNTKRDILLFYRDANYSKKGHNNIEEVIFLLEKEYNKEGEEFIIRKRYNKYDKISYNDLYCELNKLFGDFDFDVEFVTRKIIDFNNYYLNQTDEFNKYQFSKLYKKITNEKYQSIIQTGFVLGYDKEFKFLNEIRKLM